VNELILGLVCSQPMIVDGGVLVGRCRRAEVVAGAGRRREALVEKALLVVRPGDGRELDKLDDVVELARVLDALERSLSRADVDG
jgi:hypothetical protein